MEFLETKGDGNLLDEEEDIGTEEFEGEGDKYLEETCLDLGFLCLIPLSLSEDNNGDLLGLLSIDVILGFLDGLIETASEIAATIITKKTQTNSKD